MALDRGSVMTKVLRREHKDQIVRQLWPLDHRSH